MIPFGVPAAGFLTLFFSGAWANNHRHRSGPALFPVVADIGHTSPEAASFFQGYFIAKSEHDPDAWVSYFNPNSTFYYDAILGPAALNYTAWVETTKNLTSQWGQGAISYPLRVLGNIEQGAVVQFVDTPKLFGDELRILSVVDFAESQISRQVDYYDGRGTKIEKTRIADDKYDRTLGISRVTEKASPTMQRVARKLQGYLSSNNFAAAAQLFSAEGILEDTTLRSRQEGRISIEAYLQRVLPTIPYGDGATVRHVLGSDIGGGYEWITASNSMLKVLNGIIALELDSHHLITRLTAAWDSSRENYATMALLTGAVIPPKIN